jgi:NTP pyrophosphatase (non-canonical NTP hydrolase)
MQFDEYQKITKTSAVYPQGDLFFKDKDGNFHKFPLSAGEVYSAIGLGNEVGELLGVMKKRIRDNTPDEEYKAKILDESGDVAYYHNRLNSEHRIRSSEVIRLNVEKISRRLKDGTIKGSGDR